MTEHGSDCKCPECKRINRLAEGDLRLRGKGPSNGGGSLKVEGDIL